MNALEIEHLCKGFSVYRRCFISDFAVSMMQTVQRKSPLKLAEDNLLIAGGQAAISEYGSPRFVEHSFIGSFLTP